MAEHTIEHLQRLLNILERRAAIHESGEAPLAEELEFALRESAEYLTRAIIALEESERARV